MRLFDLVVKIGEVDIADPGVAWIGGVIAVFVVVILYWTRPAKVFVF